MSKVITNEEKIDEVLTRGVDEVIDLKNLKNKLLSGKKLRIKLGIDPTSPNLHLGRSVPLLKLKDFQDLGHKVVFIVGDFTGVIGDTSDKESERPMLSKDKVEADKKGYFAQVGRVINTDSAELVYNSKWLGRLDYHDVGEQANEFSLSEFISRDNIKRRLEAGKRISLREVLYPLMQGYDSVAVESDVEIGGVDQRFNLLAGRTLQKHYGQEPQDVVVTTFPIEGTDGRKMSSSWGNTINLNDRPFDMYGKVMSVNDDLIEKYFIVLTRRSLEEVEKIIKLPPKDAKMELAHEIVSMYHGEKEAKEAEENFIKTFQKGGIPEDVKTTKTKKGELLQDILVSNGLVESNSQFTRLVKEGAIKTIDKNKKETPVNDPKHKITKTSTYKVGKKRFLKIELK